MPRHAHTHSPITAGSWFGDTGRPFLDVPVAFPMLLEPFGNTERTTFGLCLQSSDEKKPALLDDTKRDAPKNYSRGSECAK